MKTVLSCREASPARGAVLLIVTLLLVVIFGVLALAIDLNLASASKEQAQHFARLSALAGLEEYVKSRGALKSHADGMTDALARAQKVAETNYMLSTGAAGEKPTLRIAAGVGALLEPGVWTIDKKSNTAIRDKDGKIERETCDKNPCFIPWSKASGWGYAQPNAMRVSGELFPGGLKSKVFSGVLSGGALPASVGAIASIVPRLGCFLVDNSASMVRKTHPKSENAEFAYFLRGMNSKFDDKKGTWVPAKDKDSSHDTSWEALADTRPDGVTDPTKHFKSDYRWKETLGDADYSKNIAVAGITSVHKYSDFHPNPADDDKFKTRDSRGDFDSGAWYAVDSYRDGVNYTGPEPLRSIFDGLNRAMRAFKDRKVAGDKACLIFYDQDISWPRVVKLTDNFDYLMALTDFGAKNAAAPLHDVGHLTPLSSRREPQTDAEKAVLDNADIAAAALTLTMAEASDFTDGVNHLTPVSGLELIARHGLFPGVLGNTNLLAALLEASNQLSTGVVGGVPASAFVVLIGDSLGNCPNCAAAAKDPDVCTGAAGAERPLVTCAEQFDYYKQATADFDHLVTKPDGIVQRGVPLHFIGVGPDILPHTVDHKIEDKPGARCFTDKEWRKFENNRGDYFGYVYSDSSGNTSDAFLGRKPTMDSSDPTKDKFLWGNQKMYEWAVRTDGLWGPVRPPRAKVDGKCEPIKCGDNSDPGVVKVGSKLLRYEDPHCRSEADQVADYMKEIMGDNPYTIVHTDQGLGGNP